MLMWIDSIVVVLAALGGLVAALTACVAAVNWVVRRQLSSLAEQISTLDRRFDTWISEHKRQHDDDRRQVAAAFRRNELSPPDGWDRTRPGERHS